MYAIFPPFTSFTILLHSFLPNLADDVVVVCGEQIDAHTAKVGIVVVDKYVRRHLHTLTQSLPLRAVKFHNRAIYIDTELQVILVELLEYVACNVKLYDLIIIVEGRAVAVTILYKILCQVTLQSLRCRSCDAQNACLLT